MNRMRRGKLLEKMIIRSGQPLAGQISVSSAKNAVLPVIAASILGTERKSVIREVPALIDVYTIVEVLRSLQIKVHYDNGNLHINANQDLTTEAPYEYVRKMRASVLVMGPLLARCGQAKVALPGGCAIGSRPIDLHLKGFEALGASIEIGKGYVEAKVNGRLKGNKIYLDIPSVGATENIMMAATLAEGETVIEHAAQEPEIIDLAKYLNRMGAKIQGAGTDKIRIQGVESMIGAEHSIMPDRIEAGTHMIAAAITRSDIMIDRAKVDYLGPLVSLLEEMGVTINPTKTGVEVLASDRQLKSVDVTTMPYPGFPTDLQPQMMALLLTTKGSSVVKETVFENRFMHVDEFKKMNAKIRIDGRSAIVTGGAKLSGTKVSATDLRAGAALILAGLVADGYSEIYELEHIDRGYENILGKYVSLGADIVRLNEKGEEIEHSEVPAIQLKLSQPSFVS